MSANNRIGYLQAAFTYASTSSFEIGYLPPNAYITDITVLVSTDFTAGIIDIGDSATANKYVNDASLNVAGKATVASTTAWGVVQSTNDQTLVKGIVVIAGTGITAGAARVIVSYAYVD